MNNPAYNTSLSREALEYLLENPDAEYLAAMMAEEEDDDYEDVDTPVYDAIPTDVVDKNGNVISYDEMQQAIIMEALNNPSEQMKKIWHTNDDKNGDWIKAANTPPVYNNQDFIDAMNYAQQHAIKHDKQIMEYEALKKIVQQQAGEISNLKSIYTSAIKTIMAQDTAIEQLTKEFETMKRHVQKMHDALSLLNIHKQNGETILKTSDMGALNAITINSSYIIIGNPNGEHIKLML